MWVTLLNSERSPDYASGRERDDELDHTGVITSRVSPLPSAKTV